MFKKMNDSSSVEFVVQQTRVNLITQVNQSSYPLANRIWNQVRRKVQSRLIREAENEAMDYALFLVGRHIMNEINNDNT